MYHLQVELRPLDKIRQCFFFSFCYCVKCILRVSLCALKLTHYGQKTRKRRLPQHFQVKENFHAFFFLFVFSSCVEHFLCVEIFSFSLTLLCIYKFNSAPFYVMERNNIQNTRKRAIFFYSISFRFVFILFQRT